MLDVAAVRDPPLDTNNTISLGLNRQIECTLIFFYICEYVTEKTLFEVEGTIIFLSFGYLLLK